ncbi:MAG: hypothetical protein ACPGJV_01090 [Bacteriovoracaceae bacterium]
MFSKTINIQIILTLFLFLVGEKTYSQEKPESENKTEVETKKSSKKTKKRSKKKYRWAKKDTPSFFVLQKREIEKLEGQYIQLNFSHYSLSGIDKTKEVLGEYHFFYQENHGYGLRIGLPYATKPDAYEKVENTELVFFNEAKWRIGGFFYWTPLYGKNIIENKVYYSDLGIRLGLDLISSEHNGNQLKNRSLSSSLESSNNFLFSASLVPRFFIGQKLFVSFEIGSWIGYLNPANGLGEEVQEKVLSTVFHTGFGVGLKI